MNPIDWTRGFEEFAGNLSGDDIANLIRAFARVLERRGFQHGRELLAAAEEISTAEATRIERLVDAALDVEHSVAPGETADVEPVVDAPFALRRCALPDCTRRHNIAGYHSGKRP